MPLFNFTCSNGHDFEKIVDRDNLSPECPECGEEAEKNPFSSSDYSIKYGTDGFYATDYKDRNRD